MLHSNQEPYLESIKLNTTVGFYLLKNLNLILKTYLGFLIQKANKKFGNFAGRLLNNSQLDADEYDFNANNQNFLEVIKKTEATTTSSNIFHTSESPKKTSEGIEVIKAIGMKTLKKILKENENEFRGNLPI